MLRGPKSAKVLLVASFPVEEQVPFVGTRWFHFMQQLGKVVDTSALQFTQASNVTPKPIRGLTLEESLLKSSVRQRHMMECHWKLGTMWLTEQLYRDAHKLLSALQQEHLQVIVTVGEWAFRAVGAVLGENFQGSWKMRGSMLRAGGKWIIPTLGPEMLNSNYALHVPVLRDLQRIRTALGSKEVPEQQVQIVRSFEQWKGIVQSLKDLENVPVAVDIETRGGHITCIGFALQKQAYVVPFCRYDGSDFWSADGEYLVVADLLTFLRRNHLVGQNWQYDAMYIEKHWGQLLVPRDDTMLMQHCCWNQQPKDLSYLSSMYCDFHVQWKQDLYNSKSGSDDEMLWLYNGKDCLVTLEVWEKLKRQVEIRQVQEIYRHEMSLWLPVMEMMQRGVRIDTFEKACITEALRRTIAKLQGDLDFVVGKELNARSNVQLYEFLIVGLGLKPVFTKTHDPLDPSKESRGIAYDDAAMENYGQQMPKLKELFTLILEIRSCQTLLGYAQATTDKVGDHERMKTSYNIGGTTTGRLSSSKTPFGRGMNLQNVTGGGVL